MGAMNAFLRRLDTAPVRALYDGLEDIWNARARALNQRLTDADVPVQVVNFSTIWTVVYTQPACYNWLFQHYLRLEGLALSWVGSGRLIFSLNYSAADFEAVSNRIVNAARAMQRDGWWEPGALATDRAIKRRILREMASHLFGFPGRGRKERLAGPQPLDAAL